MLWAILVALWALLWASAASILIWMLRTRNRPGNVPVRLRRQARNQWSPGYGVWVHDVFAFRGLPAAWKESIVWAADASARPASAAERKRLRGIGALPVVVTLRLVEGERIDLATRPEHKRDAMGPFATGPRAQIALREQHDDLEPAPYWRGGRVNPGHSG